MQTFEEVDAHVAGQSLQKIGPPSAANLCAAYKAARPVLVFVSSFIPPTWRGVLTALIGALDVTCP